MISFFYDKPNKTVYLYNSGLEIAKFWSVFKMEQDFATGFYIFSCTDRNGAVIMGTEIFAKL